MATKLTLVPDEAAASIAARVDVIKKCEAYIRDVVGRYDGLRSFEVELQRLGVSEAVLAILKRG